MQARTAEKSPMALSKLSWLCCIAAFALTAQTPAPKPAGPTPTGTPIRHLEYAFTVDYTTNGEGHNSGMAAGGEGGVDSGVNSMLGGGGRRGTMIVDVTGFTPDGALIVAVNESLQEAPRPGERFSCTVYGDGHVLCPTANGPLTDAENLLLSTLGRGFIDASAAANGGRWKRSYDGKQVFVSTTYAMTGGGDGHPAVITKHSDIQSRVRTIGDSVEDGRIDYDTALSVPDAIHDTIFETLANATIQTVIDLRLTQDSFAKHS